MTTHVFTPLIVGLLIMSPTMIVRADDGKNQRGNGIVTSSEVVANPRILAAFLVAYDHMRAESKETLPPAAGVLKSYSAISMYADSTNTATVMFFSKPAFVYGGGTIVKVDLESLKVLSVTGER
jgi:hypothetical protein